MHITKTAVDTIVLIAMAHGETRSLEACRKLSNIGQVLLVPSTVMQECEIMCQSPKLQVRDIGFKIAECLVDIWGMVPAPAESSVNHGIALQIARAIEQKFNLPEGYEENHGLVVADSGLLGCSRLLTWSTPLLSLPRVKLSLFLASKDIGVGVQILTPDEALAALCANE